MRFPTQLIIRGMGIRPVKSRGQNFLIDESLAEKTVAQADIKPDDSVVEIGPGPGALTFFIAQQAAHVHCFEIDRNLCARLTEDFSDSPVVMYNQDILKADFEGLRPVEGGMILMGSIPYNITSQIVLKFFSTARLFRHAVLVVQKEFAQRLCASSGGRDYGILSVFAQAYAPSRYLFTLSGKCFYPKPNVDSAAIILVPDATRDWMDAREVFFQKVVRAAFSMRRKKLKNCLKAFLGADPAGAQDGLLEAGIDLGRRAETLSLEEFDTLTDFLRGV